jgi:predicted DNA-binding transcriptional regulator AlpA
MADTLFHVCMRTPEAARYMAISKSRLTQLRMTGEGPPFIKIAARAVAYRKSDLDAWLDNRVRRATSDKSKA